MATSCAFNMRLTAGLDERPTKPGADEVRGGERQILGEPSQCGVLPLRETHGHEDATRI